MRLTEQSKYAVMVLVSLATQRPSSTTVPEIASETGISEANIFKLLKTLTKAGLATSLRGRGGGISLPRNPDTITLGEILRAFEPRFQECKPAEIMMMDQAKSHAAYQLTDSMIGLGIRAFFKELDQITVGDIERQAETKDLRRIG